MFDFNKNILLIPSILLFLAAVIFAWAVVMQRAPQQAGSTQGVSQIQAKARPQLPAGTPNPADSLPQLGAVALAGKITAVSGSAVTIQLGVLGGETAPSATFQTNAKTLLYKRGASKDAAVYKKEMDDFLAKLAYAAPDASVVYLAPEPYERVALRLSDLKTDTLVAITPSADNLETAATIFVAAQL